MRKMLERQTKNLPKDQREQLMMMLEKDPDLFMKIAQEVQAEMKKGKDQMSAAIIVMPKYQARLKELMGRK